MVFWGPTSLSLATNAMSSRVGTLDYTGLALYKRTDNTLYWMDDGIRVDLHGATLWTRNNGVKMRGARPVNAIASSSAGKAKKGIAKQRKSRPTTDGDE